MDRSEIKATQAIVLRGHIKLLALGMTHSSGLTLTKALKLASAITGQTYKRTQHEKARADLNEYVFGS